MRNHLYPVSLPLLVHWNENLRAGNLRVRASNLPGWKKETIQIRADDGSVIRVSPNGEVVTEGGNADGKAYDFGPDAFPSFPSVPSDEESSHSYSDDSFGSDSDVDADTKNILTMIETAPKEQLMLLREELKRGKIAGASAPISTAATNPTNPFAGIGGGGIGGAGSMNASGNSNTHGSGNGASLGRGSAGGVGIPANSVTAPAGAAAGSSLAEAIASENARALESLQNGGGETPVHVVVAI